MFTINKYYDIIKDGGGICKMEQDYKKMYLEQKLTALQMEIQLLQNRFGDIQQQLKKTQAEYEAYSAPVPEPVETEPVETEETDICSDPEETEPEPVEEDVSETPETPDEI